MKHVLNFKQFLNESIINEGMTPKVTKSSVKLVHIEIPNRESRSSFDKTLKLNIEEDDLEVIKSTLKSWVEGEESDASGKLKDGGYINITGMDNKKDEARIQIQSQYFSASPKMTDTDIEFLLYVLEGDSVQTAIKKAKEGEEDADKDKSSNSKSDKPKLPPPPLPPRVFPKKRD
jgi:hypothetical protein